MRNVPPSRCMTRRSVVRSVFACRRPRAELRQAHVRLLAELRERQPEVGVDVQPRRCDDLVEDRHALIVVARARGSALTSGSAVPRGPTGSPSATHVRPCTPYIRNAVRSSFQSSALSRRNTRLADVRSLRRRRRGRVGQLARRRRHDCRTRGRPQQPPHSDERAAHQHADGRAQEARRVLLRPRTATTARASTRRAGTRTARGRPTRPRPRTADVSQPAENGNVEERRLAVELVAAGHERHQQRRQDDAPPRSRRPSAATPRCPTDESRRRRAHTRRRAGARGPTRRRAARSRRGCRRNATARAPAAARSA